MCISLGCSTSPLQWRHNGRGSVSNHQPHDFLLNRLFRRRSKKTSKLRATGLCAGNSPATGEFPAQMASNAENVSMWWRPHVKEAIRCQSIPNIEHVSENSCKRPQFVTWQSFVIIYHHCHQSVICVLYGLFGLIKSTPNAYHIFSRVYLIFYSPFSEQRSLLELIITPYWGCS